MFEWLGRLWMKGLLLLDVDIGYWILNLLDFTLDEENEHWETQYLDWCWPSGTSMLDLCHDDVQQVIDQWKRYSDNTDAII